MVAGDRRRPAASNAAETVMGSPPIAQRTALLYRASRSTARVRARDRTPAPPTPCGSWQLVGHAPLNRPQRASRARPRRRSKPCGSASDAPLPGFVRGVWPIPADRVVDVFVAFET